MPLAVLFLLLGTLAAEITLFGVWIAAPIGAGLLSCSAFSLAVVGLSRRRQRRKALAAAVASARPGPPALRTITTTPASAPAAPAQRSAAA